MLMRGAFSIGRTAKPPIPGSGASRAKAGRRAASRTPAPPRPWRSWRGRGRECPGLAPRVKGLGQYTRAIVLAPGLGRPCRARAHSPASGAEYSALTEPEHSGKRGFALASMSLVPAICEIVLQMPSFISLRAQVRAPPDRRRTVAATLRDCADCPELVVMPAGSFSLGTAADACEHDEASGETPPLAVGIRHPLAIGRFEVQASEFARFAAETGHRPTLPCALGPRRRPVASLRRMPRPASPGSADAAATATACLRRRNGSARTAGRLLHPQLPGAPAG